MSTTVDQRVVEMRFDNRNFEQNVSTTMSTLDKLKRGLHLDGATKGLQDIDSASRKVDMSTLGSAVETVQAKFSALSVIGVTALANITNSAVNAGKKIVSALTIDPIKTGFEEYETQINAVQTILANTESKGSTINDVNKALDTLNLYADKTIYNFTEMTRNIGTFTAAGVDLETSVSAIQGIANMAAVSGSTSQQASTAMYQLSQALAAGTVKLMDWNSVVNAGMGGQVFQDALKETSKQMVKNAKAFKKMSAAQKKAWQESHGYTDEQMKSMQKYSFDVDKLIKKNGSFRESLSEGWITADVLTMTLGKMTKTGVVDYVVDMTGATKESVQELQKLGDEVGYSNDKVKELALSIANGDEELANSVISTVKMATTAEDAATKVKTLTQLWDTLKEAAQSGWTQSWETIVGDFEEAKELYTRISDAVGGIISASAESRNKVLSEGLSSGWKQFITAAEADEELLKESITSTAKELGVPLDELIEKNGSFEKSLKEGWMTSDILKKSITGLADKTKDLSDEQLLAMGYTREQATAIQELSKKVQNGEVDLDRFADSMAKVSGRENVIEGFAAIFSNLAKVVKPIGEAFREVFAPITGEQVYSITERFRNFAESIEISGDTLDRIKRTFKGFFSILDIGKKAITAILNPLLQLGRSEGIASLGDFLLETAASLGDFFTTLNEGFGTEGLTATLSGVASGISNFLTKVFGNLGGFSGIFTSIGNTICKVANTIWGAVTKVFGWIKENINLGSIGSMLAGGGIVVAVNKLIGLIDKIKDSIKNLFGGKVEGIKDKISDILGSVNDSLQAFTSGIKIGSIVAIAIAIGILSASLTSIAKLDAEDVSKGLFAIGAMLLELSLSFKAINKALSKFKSKGLIKAGLALVLLASAVRILSGALVKLSGLSLKEIGKGLLALGGCLLELCGAIKLINGVKIPLRTSIAILALAESCKILADAFEKFSAFSWDEIAHGLVVMGGALGELVIAMSVLQKFSGFNSLFGSLGILIVVQSLEKMAEGLKKFSEMSWSEIGRGLTAMGGALVEVGGVVTAVGKIAGFSSIFGAGAIWIVVQGLDDLAASLKSFAEMSWSEIGRGLASMGGALAEVGGVVTAVGMLAGFSAIFGAGGILITIQGLDDLANALKSFAEMQWDEIGRGLTAMGGALAEVGGISAAVGALAGFSAIFGAGAIWVAIQGLDDLATALARFADMSWSEIGRGLTAMGGALLEVGAVSGATGALTGIAGLAGAGTILLAVQGLDDLANGLQKFGEMSWDEIGRGLSAMGGALAEIAVGGLLNSLSGLGALSIETIAGPLGTLADSVKKWVGVEVPEGLGLSLLSLASGIQTFTFSGLGAGALATAAAPLGTLADSVQKWSGVTVPANMETNLSSLAKGIEAFSWAFMGGWSMSAAVEPLKDLAGSISAWNGVTVPANMETNLTSLANGVKAFSWAFMGGWSMSAAVEPLKNLAGSISAWNEVTVPANMETNLTSLANGVKAFSWAFMGGWSMDAVDGPLTSLATAVKAWNGVTVPQGLETNLTSLANGAKAFSWAFLGGWSIGAIDGPLESLATAVKAWNGVTVPANMETNLTSLANGVKAFTFGGLGADALSAAAPGVGVMADSVSKWSGVIVPEGLGTSLSTLATGVQAFTFGGLGADALVAAAPGVGAMADSIKKWSGVTVPEGLGTSLSGLATGVKAFTLGGFGADTLSIAASGVGAMADSIKKWSGVTIPEGLGTNLSSLADGVKSFRFSGSSANSLSTAASGLGTMANSVKKWSGVSIPDGLDSKLSSLANSVKKFKDLTGVNSGIDSMNNIHTAASKLSKIDFNAISSGLKKLVSAMNGLGSVNSESVSGFGAVISTLTTQLTGASGQFSAAGSQIATSIAAGITSGQSATTAATAKLMTSATKAITSKASAFRSAGSTLASNLASGIRSGSSSVSSAGSSVASSGVSGVRSKRGAMSDAGRYLGEGLVAGINAMEQEVYWAGYDLGKAAVDGEKAGQASASPSKLTIKAGKWLGEGLIIGMECMGRSVHNAGENMGQSAVNATRSAMTTVLDALNSDMDAQPTIRPVVDLSDVQTGAAAVSGMFNGIQTVGVRTNLNAINASMNAKLQNGANDDIVSAINKLNDGLANSRGDTYNFGDFTYDDGSNVADAVGTLIRYARIGRRV